MPVPRYQAFVEPLLRTLADNPDGLRTARAHEAVAARLGLSDADRAELLPSGAQPVFKNRNGWAHDRLKRAGLSESSAFGAWRLTKAGLAFVRAHPGPLADEELAKITDIAEKNQAVVWRDRLAVCRADTAWAAERAATNVTRIQIRPQIIELIERFLCDATSPEEFRAVFDKKTRREWSVFGGKGPGGAMMINKLVKHAPDRDRLATELKALITKPSDEPAAAGAIRRFADYLSSARASVQDPSKLPGDRRIQFIASSFWHVQEPEAWPAYYNSAVKVLASDGLFDSEGLDIAEQYLAFRSAFQGLQKALDIPSWDLESLLHWIQRDDDAGALANPDAEDSDESPTPRVWLIALGRNAEHWEACYRDGTIAIGWNDLGDLSQYQSLEAIRTKLRQDRDGDADPVNASLACWQFVHDMHGGDPVYVKRGRHEIIGHGTITSGYRYDPERPLANVRDVKWLGRGKWKPREKALVMKTLTEIGRYPGLLRNIRAATGELDESEGVTETPKTLTIPPYGLEDAEQDLFLTRDQLSEMVELCRYKKNVILQGPPGVGKTFVATRLAHLLIESKNEDQIQRVQFHPSYSYEDFVQGLRPVEGGGFARKDGPLLSFCKDALEDQASPYVLIIDEINRGNVSKILGELLSLIEADKRDPRYGVTLAYARDDEPRFHVPPNLFIIGMMNTADRSLAFVDYALRRRFVFFDIEPAFGTERFEADLIRRGVESSLRKTIQDRLTAINQRIVADPMLGRGYQIGHSYFCQRADTYDEAWFDRIVTYELVPLLREYWSDSPANLTESIAELRDE